MRVKSIPEIPELEFRQTDTVITSPATTFVLLEIADIDADAASASTPKSNKFRQFDFGKFKPHET